MKKRTGPKARPSFTHTKSLLRLADGEIDSYRALAKHAGMKHISELLEAQLRRLKRAA